MKTAPTRLERNHKTPAVSRAPRIRPVPAVTRSVAILRFLGRAEEPQGVKAIAAGLGLVPSTALHILRVLVDEGLVRVDTSKRYTLGSGLLALARSLLATRGFASAAQPALDRLSRTWRVTALAVEIEGIEHMVVVALSKSILPFRLHVDVGSRFPALISATGRLVAAYSTQSAQVLEDRFRSLRWQSPPDIAAWRRQVASARRHGYAIDRGNYIGGVTLASVPVFDVTGSLTHTLVAAGMAGQFDADQMQAMIADLRGEAAQLGAGDET